MLRELNDLRRIEMREWNSQRGKQLRNDLIRFAINDDQTEYKIYALMSSSLKQYIELIKPQTVVRSSINEILLKKRKKNYDKKLVKN